MAALSALIPAATLVLYLETEPGPARHLMLQRSANMAFAAGALVFPGGRVDVGDHELARQAALILNPPDDAEDAAARIAAIRETIEEAGIAVGVMPAPSELLLSQWRVALKAHVPLAALLAAAGCRLDLGVLLAFARWCPNFPEARRFDTRFYVARCNQPTMVEVDADEATQHFWLSAKAAIAGGQSGLHHVIYPTMRNLERLAAHPHFEDVQAHVATVVLKTITPVVEKRDGETWLLIPDDAGYPVTAGRLGERLRAVGDAGGDAG